MPPPPARLASQQNKQTTVTTFPKGIVTRSKRTTLASEENQHNGGKRKADSPLKAKVTKRSAFGDITNAIGKSANDTKKVLKNVANNHGKSLAVFKDKKPVEKKEAIPKPAPRLTLQLQSNHLQQASRKTATAAAAAALLVQSASEATSKIKSKEPAQPVKAAVPKEAPTRASLRLSARLSLDNDSGESSLYVSALEDISGNTLDLATPSAEEKSEESEVTSSKSVARLPPGVNDFDAENIKDVHSVSDFAMDIFTYLKDRESEFIIDDYMEKQFHLSRWMRSLLVDWMVEVQENFELNHETLYLAVKVVDLYLSKVTITKEKLQLVGAAAVFIASKFDERVPPLVDDLIYICDGAYSHQELIRMETAVLRVIDFDLGIPLSYRFLRRYARCAGIAMPQLTLARYILEMALMEYSLIRLSDSKLAAAALLLALRMQNLGGWTPTLEYYSGYNVEDIKSICYDLNEMLHKKPKAALATVRNKYSHKVFFEVATLPLLDDMDLNI